MGRLSHPFKIGDEILRCHCPCFNFSFLIKLLAKIVNFMSLCLKGIINEIMTAIFPGLVTLSEETNYFFIVKFLL